MQGGNPGRGPQQEAKSPGRVGEAPGFGVPTVPGTMAAVLYP